MISRLSCLGSLAQKLRQRLKSREGFRGHQPKHYLHIPPRYDDKIPLDMTPGYALLCVQALFHGEPQSQTQ